MFTMVAHAVAGSTTSPLTLSPMMVTSVTAGPPAAVISSFHSIFGNPVVSEWKARSHGQWRAHFVRNGIAWEATFTSSGALIKSEPA